ncbi:MAG: hypothetical protein GEU81_11160 [Nitriliruptorales bacterium]|nr:hypothetical protein [Nitriliruptorales bacterium]
MVKRCIALVLCGVLLAACARDAAPSAAPEGTGGPDQTGGEQPADSSSATAESISLDLYSCCVSGTEMGIWVALDNGIFEAHGLDVNYTVLPPPTGLQAITAGDVQIGTDSPGSLVNAVAGGAEDLAFVSGNVSRPVYRIMTGAGLDSPEDLRGRRIGVSGKWAAPAVAVMNYMDRELGMQLDVDYETVPFRTISDILPALEGGVIDAGVLSTPLHLQAEQAGLTTVVNLADTFDEANAWIVTSGSFAAENPEAVTRFLRAYVEAMGIVRDDPATAIASVKQHVEGISDEGAEVTYEEYADLMSVDMSVQALEPYARYTDNPAVGEVDLEQLIDYSYLEQLEESGFLEEHGVELQADG